MFNPTTLSFNKQLIDLFEGSKLIGQGVVTFGQFNGLIFPIVTTIEYSNNNIKYRAKIERIDDSNLFKVLSNEIVDLTSLEIILTHTKYCEVDVVENPSIIKFFDDNNMIDEPSYCLGAYIVVESSIKIESKELMFKCMIQDTLVTINSTYQEPYCLSVFTLNSFTITK
jgi:hypothetical protein